jgi:hypothetical protein
MSSLWLEKASPNVGEAFLSEASIYANNHQPITEKKHLVYGFCAEK